jgi:PAS domain S-box-containing protein
VNRVPPDQPPPDRAAAWIPYVALLVALGTTAIVTAYVAREASARDAFRFESAVAEVRNDITAQLETSISYLRAGAGLIAARPDVTRDEWRAFVRRMEITQDWPGLRSIGFSRRLTGKEEAQAALAELRASIGPDVRLHPDHESDERHAIVYLEPLEDPRNRLALGYDMLTESRRREAMYRARDTARPAASGKVHLVQDAGENRPKAGFLIYMPVYATGEPPTHPEDRAEQLVGFVYSPMRMDDLMGATFGGRTTSTVRFDVYDGDAVPVNLLHRTPADVGYEPRRTARHPLVVAGRKWTLDFASLPRFDVESGRDLRPIVLIVGVTLSLVLFLLTRSQYGARRAAERIAQELRASEHALRLSESRFRRLAESNLIGVVFCDVNGRITRGNLEFFRLIGYDREQVLSGRVRMDTLTAPEYRAADAVAQAKLRTVGVAEPYEKELVRHDGIRVPVLIGMAMLEGSTTDCVAFCIDLTPSKHAARELHRAKEQAEAANRAKDQFLAVLSHELRTPLTPVLAVSTAAQVNVELPDQVRADFSMIRRNVELEAKLIDDLLDLTRLGRGKIHLHVDTLDAHQVVRHAVNVSSSDEIAMKHLALRVDLAAERHYVRGDAARLQQVVWNLLKNAVKFTPPGGTVTVTTRNDALNRLVIEVSDTGVGIDPEVLPRIFDAFEQGEAAVARHFGGLGLGLAISKGLVAAHGGTIAAHSAGRNRGATFTVTLDTVPDAPPTRRPAAPPLERDRTSRLAILLVEDHADTARALTRLLDAAGYDVRAADSVQSALNLAAQTDFDVLVSDLGLPDGSGLDVMRHLRQRAARRDDGRRMAGIALTGYGMEEDLAKTRDAGFDEHITKPVNFDSLQAAIRRVTAATEAEAEAEAEAGESVA